MVAALVLFGCSSNKLVSQPCEATATTPNVSTFGGADLTTLMPDGAWSSDTPAYGASGPVTVTLDATLAGDAYGLTNLSCFYAPEREGDYLVVPVSWRASSDDGYLDVSDEGELQFRDDTWRFFAELDAGEVEDHPFDYGLDTPSKLGITLAATLNGPSSAEVHEQYKGAGTDGYWRIVYSSNQATVEAPVR